MTNCKTTACVTGASGMIGRRIVNNLLLEGYKVRVLSRSDIFNADSRIELFKAGFENEQIVKNFLNGGDLLFHCAGELSDKTKMWNVNVLGTDLLFGLAAIFGVKYFCHISSAGVIGLTNEKWVDENSNCNPQNNYELSKWEAEKIVAQGIVGCKVIILRPINVVDDDKPGALGHPLHNTWLDKIKVFVKGAECAHIVHAENVAKAALFFISHKINSPQCFFVSCDDDKLNTYAGLWGTFKEILNNKSTENISPITHLPLVIPYIIRSLWRGKSNWGDVRYSPDKLRYEGFHLPLDVFKTVKMVVSKYNNSHRIDETNHNK
jgi:nucleoside-diphosphate-sugar epimerase